MSDQAPTARGIDRFLLAIVVGAVLLIVLSVAAVLLVGRRPAPTADPTTPGGTVQIYVELVRAGSLERAYGYLSRSAQASVPPDRFRQDGARYVGSSRTGERLLVEPLAVTGDTAEVKVTVSRFTARSDPFSSGSYHRDVAVNLVREDGAWRIDRPTDPSPFLY
jgi:hypothetical protein